MPEKFDKEWPVLGVGEVELFELSLGTGNCGLHAGSEVSVRRGAL